MATGPVIQLAVFGNPVGQSLSPEIHRNFAEQCGLNVDYQAIEASTESFPEQVRTLAGRGGRGCNITAPFKKDAWRLAGDCSETARRVNTGGDDGAVTVCTNPDCSCKAVLGCITTRLRVSIPWGRTLTSIT